MTSRQQENLTEKIASWVARVSARDFPRTAKDRAKEHLLDGFATMLAGAQDNASLRIDRHLQKLGSKSQSTVIGTNTKLAAQHAALANGIRGHVLDYDDAQLASLPSRPFGQLTHPTTPVLAATLALAEATEADGSSLLTAYMVGVEVACRLADAIDPRHYLDGFHPTGTMGAFGATAACAHLLKLDERRVACALGIAGSLASGVRAQRGTMAKSLNAGRAAENGVVAATLARTGFTASTNIFEDPMGYLSAACSGKIDRRLIKLGKPHFFSDPGVAIKIYPCAAVMHPALDALIVLAKTHRIQPIEVKRIRVALGPDAALPLVYEKPRSGLEGKFSLPFSAAVAVIHRKAGPGEYTDEQVRNPKVTALMKSVELVRILRLKSKGNLGAQAEVEILLHNGHCYHRRATMAKGHPKKPLSRFELEEKFRQCAEGLIPSGKAQDFVAALWSIEKVSALVPWVRSLCLSHR